MRKFLLLFFPLLEDVGGFGLYWACGIEGDGNEGKQKGRSGQMSGGGMAENYIGFGYESAFWRKEKIILGLAVDLRFGGRRRVEQRG
nr:hypothetical protein CFP56_62675 [Quercus suber]